MACADPSATPPEQDIPFELLVRQRDGVPLLQLHFESFGAASATGPYVLTVVEGEWTREVTADIDFCAQFACTGSLTREQLVVTADPGFSNPLVGFTCIGIDGTFFSGVDAGGSGDCAE